MNWDFNFGLMFGVVIGSYFTWLIEKYKKV